MSRDDGGPAFPHVLGGAIENGGIGSTRTITFGIESGMSLRDWFAGQVLAGMNLEIHINRDSRIARSVEGVADYAYELADEMLKRRSDKS